MTDTPVIPAAPEELQAPRLPGQSFGNPGSNWPVQDRVGHKSDYDSYTRSRNLVYKRKITKQKARSKA
jgi:hypothetical protein